eukprot:CAMPEP_0171242864 /NCGR_PEP_ID=MMETSP0790-20130122/45956_1 /TAXON_ID=2925 /ORGANISM="Alexandrium catenella, Strain OF101" /LENGTH=186 /DNA_ID=CAMNT_0011709769 /DNA_START=75 /DNA_END=633 /DNA_ORIENTATION=+
MTIQNKLIIARRVRSEEELRDVVTSGSSTRIQAVCKRAEVAGVSRTSIEAALAVAEKLIAGDYGASAPGHAPGLVAADWDSSLTRARRLRAEQELDAASDLSPKQVEAACRRAEIAGVACETVEAAREAMRQLVAAEEEEANKAATAVPTEHVLEIAGVAGGERAAMTGQAAAATQANGARAAYFT